MTMLRRSSRGSSRSSVRRALTWTFNATTLSTVAIGASSVFDLTALVSSDVKRDATITRVRGEVMVEMSPAAFSGAIGFYYQGLVVVTADAFNSGVGALPDPETDEGDWMWYNSGSIRIPTRRNDADTAELESRAIRYIELDTKAQRKLPENNRLLCYVFKNDGASNRALNVAIQARTLLKRA